MSTYSFLLALALFGASTASLDRVNCDFGLRAGNGICAYSNHPDNSASAWSINNGSPRISQKLDGPLKGLNNSGNLWYIKSTLTNYSYQYKLFSSFGKMPSYLLRPWSFQEVIVCRSTFTSRVQNQDLNHRRRTAPCSTSTAIKKMLRQGATEATHCSHVTQRVVLSTDGNIIRRLSSLKRQTTKSL